jgi:hypothetical protein
LFGITGASTQPFIAIAIGWIDRLVESWLHVADLEANRDGKR